MRLLAAIFIAIAMMMSGAVSATAHTQLHLGELSSAVSADHEHGAALLHKSLYAHSDHDHHHDHHQDDHDTDHHSDDHTSHCHGFAVTASTIGIDTTGWDAPARVIEHDDRVADPLYLAEHIPD